MGERAGRWVAGGLAVVLVALLVAIGLVVTRQDDGDAALTAAHQDVAGAARRVALASHPDDHRDWAPLIHAVPDGATGGFAKQYASQRETLTSEAVRTEATSTPEVVALGVGDQDEESATVLVAANSTVTNTGTGADGQVRYYRLRLRLVREDDRWLTSDLQFVR